MVVQIIVLVEVLLVEIPEAKVQQEEIGEGIVQNLQDMQFDIRTVELSEELPLV